MNWFKDRICGLFSLGSWKNLGEFLLLRKVYLTGGVSLAVLTAVLGYFFYNRPSSPETDPAAQIASDPLQTLSTMSDAELLSFSVDGRLPTTLVPNNWVQARVIRESLRERLPEELVRRWKRDASPLDTQPSSNSASHIQSGNPWTSIDTSKPGVLGVQVIDHGFGPRVTQVYPDSAASKAGLNVGDQIVAVNRRRIISQGELVGQLRDAAHRGGFAEIEIQRGYQTYAVQVDVSGRPTHVARNGVRLR